ncbi:MAG: ribonuclease HI family protein [Thermoplasmata archaeon]|nr:ribonuclease HI family protein [Thermoplasmata archaeon]
MTDLESRLPRGRVVLPSDVHVHFDGACQPPGGGGVATYGLTVQGGGFSYEEKGLAVPPGSPRATNNVAEYAGAIRSLEWLHEQGYSGPVRVLGDSQLVIRQMNGEYRVRAPHLKEYQAHLRRLADSFERIDFVWIPREANARADELSKEALEVEWQQAGTARPETPVTPKADGDESPDRDSGSEKPKGH